MSELIEALSVKNQYDLNQIKSDLDFYYNTLVRNHDNGEIIVELWVKKGVSNAPVTTHAPKSLTAQGAYPP